MNKKTTYSLQTMSVILTITLLFTSCKKYMYPEYEQAKNARTLLTGAWVLLTRNNNLFTTSTAPLLELSLFGEMGLAPRNTVTLALDTPWDQEVGSSAFQGVWLSVFSGIFLAEDNVRMFFGSSFCLFCKAPLLYFWSTGNIPARLCKHERRCSRPDFGMISLLAR